MDLLDVVAVKLVPECLQMLLFVLFQKLNQGNLEELDVILSKLKFKAMTQDLFQRGNFIGVFSADDDSLEEACELRIIQEMRVGRFLDNVTFMD